ncbi:restriction endonuclease subunit S [Pseudomonas sp. MDT1-17]
MTALLTDNLPLLAGAPNGIKKLRELILELAVRGKLVEQDACDEPASDLLKRIANEKTRLVAEDGLRTTARDDVPEDEHYLKLNSGWVYSRLGNLARFIDYRGRTPTKTTTGIPLITAKNVRVGFISRDPQEFIAEEDYMSWMTRGLPRLGDMLFTTEAPMGNIALIDISEKFALAQRVICFQLHELQIGPFLKLAIMSTAFQMRLLNAATGMTATGIKSSRLKEIPVALPPLAEQYRIVAKVDELMALCDRLETQQAHAVSAHAQLVQALLGSLTQANDATDFAANWQRLTEHFHTLFSTEPSIDALKQTLLELAVKGKLVPQDPSDESASELLKREGINAEPSALAGWVNVPLGKLGPVLGGATPSKAKPEYWVGDIPWVSPKDMKRALIGDAADHVSAKAVQETALKLVPTGSLLMVVRGMILIHSFPVALTTSDVTINQDMKALVVPSEIKNYMLFYLQAMKGMAVELVDRSSHGTCKLISEKLWSINVCLPPLAEQHRIVAKVDQLMALCDTLKQQINAATEKQSALLNAMMAQA